MKVADRGGRDKRACCCMHKHLCMRRRRKTNSSNKNKCMSAASTCTLISFLPLREPAQRHGGLEGWGRRGRGGGRVFSVKKSHFPAEISAGRSRLQLLDEIHEFTKQSCCLIESHVIWWGEMSRVFGWQTPESQTQSFSVKKKPTKKNLEMKTDDKQGCCSFCAPGSSLLIRISTY